MHPTAKGFMLDVILQSCRISPFFCFNSSPTQWMRL